MGGSTPQLIGRNASKELWTREELKCHMLSPKGKNKQGKEVRTDFSPTRKQLFKGLIHLLALRITDFAKVNIKVFNIQIHIQVHFGACVTF